ncbi:MAG: transglutaminase family protein [Planctomycetota bacterium]|jgi:regulator of sirC expression with transglutaminase-like and TPR domain
MAVIPRLKPVTKALQLGLLAVILSQSFLNVARAEEPKSDETTTATSESRVAELAAKVRDSIVVVTFDGRDGRQQGLGTGFVVSEDGLIATNLHVIGEARPISVQFADGDRHDVVSVHATEKAMDLALIRIEKKGLKPLELGDSSTLQAGTEVVAVGNPQGLRHSVVSGVVSEQREVDGKPMLQLAMPIERGNSGGPVLDMQGRVHGIITLKSAVTRNLGFAVVINALKPLLEKPNPVPISQWKTIGALRERDWTPLFGANWRQRAGRILVDDAGSGFGGRSLCLSTQMVPDEPFEVAVEVKFVPDDGAAGLVFHSDGKQRHYGFYPSNGRLRLTRFNGPSVYTWKVLDERPHKSYRPGEWNRLKVRVSQDLVQCFINDELVSESTDDALASGAVGLAKFRSTEAEFRNFRVATSIPSTRPDEEVLTRVADVSDTLPLDTPPPQAAVDKLLPDGLIAATALEQEARQLEQRAARLRELAAEVHAQKTQQELKELFDSESGDVDLLRAALLIARLDNPEVDVDAYVREVELMVEDIELTLADDASQDDKLAALNKYLFEQLGFHGSRMEYYNRSNSYLNEVIDDREGLPITLSVLYIEIARRLDLTVHGIGLPGHFVVRAENPDSPSQVLDVFDKARVMSSEEILTQVRQYFPVEDDERIASLTKEYLKPSESRSILVRMLSNLRSVAEEDDDFDAVLRYLTTALAIDPDDLESRVRRIQTQAVTGRFAGAIADIDWMLEKRPDGLDVERVLRMRADLEARLQSADAQ